MTQSKIAIEARGISKSYRAGNDDQSILENLDIQVHAGEFVVILGRSGSGKTTLLNLLGAMDHPDRGHIALGGTRIGRSESERSRIRRQHIGFVFQSFNLIPTLTVMENLALPLQLSGSEISDQPFNLLQRLGLLDMRDRYPNELSGGEQQRVAIARAAIHQPVVIIADEPTGNLDLENGRKVVALLDEFVRERQTALVMATHSRDVMGYADRVLRIENGHLLPA